MCRPGVSVYVCEHLWPRTTASTTVAAMSDSTDLTTLSIKELKELIRSSGLSFEDCIDKADLRSRAAEAQERLEASAPKGGGGGGGGGGGSSAAGGMARASKTFGGYDALVIGPPSVLDGSEAAELAVIVLHGLGATKEDFADLPRMLGGEQALAGRRLVYVLPQAPPSPLLGAAWWQINVAAFLAISTASPDSMAKMIREEPVGLSQCREKLQKLCAEVRAFAGGGSALPSRRLLLAGFSQGAMTAMDTALHMPPTEPPAGVVFLSGAPIVVEQWSARLQALKQAGEALPVLVTHGMADGTLPFACSGWVRDLLTANGADVKYVTHPGGHDLGGASVVRSLVSFVAARLADRA